MDPRKLLFLQAIAGQDGAKALVKAASPSADLEWAVLPRVLLAWLEVVSHGEFHDNLPGVNDTNLFLKKSENGFDGHIDIDHQVYKFQDVSLFHVAGSIAVSLGFSPDSPELKSPKLAVLGKSIDLLVKSRTLNRIAQAQKVKLPGIDKAENKAKDGLQPDGQNAPLIAPATQVPQVGAQGNPSNEQMKNGAAASSVNLPGTKPNKGLKVLKSQANTPCSTCGEQQFKDDTFIGCLCLKSLAKNTKTVVISTGYNIFFDSHWDIDAILTLAENLKI